MNISPGEITQMAYANQVRTNAAIEKELISIATAKPCTCADYQPAAVYNIDR
jgi:hypothetical protein